MRLTKSDEPILESYEAEEEDDEGAEEPEPHEINLENITLTEVLLYCLLDGHIQTQSGPKKIVGHLSWPCGHTDETWVYRCVGCGRICCGCFGGAPDERCDICVVKGEPGGLAARIRVFLEAFVPVHPTAEKPEAPARARN